MPIIPEISGTVDPQIARLAESIGATRALMARLGGAGERHLHRHFRVLDARGNKRGWPSHHFWQREVAQNTALAAVAEDAAEISIASPAFAHKLYGGTITPKRAKFLAIPLTADAYEHSPKNRTDVEQWAFRGRTMGVVDATGQYEAQYALVPSVTHAPQPDALPDDLDEYLRATAQEWAQEKAHDLASGKNS